MKTVWPLGGKWGHDPDCKHRNLRDGRKPQSMRAQGPPLHTQERIELLRASVFMDSGGITLEFTSCCYFLLLHFSYIQFFFPPFLFKSQKKEKKMCGDRE